MDNEKTTCFYAKAIELSMSKILQTSAPGGMLVFTGRAGFPWHERFA